MKASQGNVKLNRKRLWFSTKFRFREMGKGNEWQNLKSVKFIGWEGKSPDLSFLSLFPTLQINFLWPSQGPRRLAADGPILSNFDYSCLFDLPPGLSDVVLAHQKRPEIHSRKELDFSRRKMIYFILFDNDLSYISGEVPSHSPYYTFLFLFSIIFLSFNYANKRPSSPSHAILLVVLGPLIVIFGNIDDDEK